MVNASLSLAQMRSPTSGSRPPSYVGHVLPVLSIAVVAMNGLLFTSACMPSSIRCSTSPIACCPVAIRQLVRIFCYSVPRHLKDKHSTAPSPRLTGTLIQYARGAVSNCPLPSLTEESHLRTLCRPAWEELGPTNGARLELPELSRGSRSCPGVGCATVTAGCCEVFVTTQLRHLSQLRQNPHHNCAEADSPFSYCCVHTRLIMRHKAR